ncbi:GDCCVxC domain-containing (seleno)protein [Gracilimonas sp.]|uniref:GDCCVxC domain-containing (seleno)protein n=1 Tax=Gracilimonas sp. TaxID=1974203 RepID=UPI0028711DBB|nr:GDCCVxC domain-containing (seleno)protein [Gracilimonas sp.]
MDDKITLTSVLTCPNCGARQQEQMPENSCQYFWECPDCSQLLKPKTGDCCVFCSYGDVACPPVQKEGHCC